MGAVAIPLGAVAMYRKERYAIAALVLGIMSIVMAIVFILIWLAILISVIG